MDQREKLLPKKLEVVESGKVLALTFLVLHHQMNNGSIMAIRLKC